MAGRIAQVNVSPGGVPKRPVPEARVTPLGIEGDGHRDRERHGGPERALCLFALER
ncbi:MAG: MOSC domain-containing protein, partial [Candidatus Rokuibacteriota bacterium]